MGKLKHISIFMLLVAVCCGCDKYLDKVQDFDGLQEEDVFSDVQLASDFLDGAYTYLITETSAAHKLTSDHLPGMTMGNETYPAQVLYNVPELYDIYAQGDYLTLINWNSNYRAAPNFTTRYIEAWKGIRTVDEFLDRANEIENGTEKEIRGLKGQAYFIRAFLYHLLTKRHGGLPYLKEPINLNGSYDRTRDTYESNVQDMLADLDKAINLLPDEWPDSGYGRPTKAAALALKSRMTLFAASPLANPGNDKEKWQLAAQSAADMLKYAQNHPRFQLKDASSAGNLDVGPNGSDLFEAEPEPLLPYRNIFVGEGSSKDTPQGVIYQEVNPTVDGPFKGLNPIENTSQTVGFNIIKGNSYPMGSGALANYADLYETKNGLAIEDDPDYNPQDPFINRDPRFYNNILYDGVKWQYTNGALNKTGRVDLARVNEQGNLGKDLFDPTSNKLWRVLNKTGLKVRKWLPNGLWWRNGSHGSWNYHVNGIVMRIAETYLNYAEAVNEISGPNGTADGVGMTALQAVNRVRNRVGMPNMQSRYLGSKDAFRKRVHNERAVEFSFEGFRYDDIRRWKTATKNRNLTVKFLTMKWQGGPSQTYPTGFSFEEDVQPNLRKTFTEKNYWWPIPTADLEAVPSFNQTKGW